MPLLDEVQTTQGERPEMAQAPSRADPTPCSGRPGSLTEPYRSIEPRLQPYAKGARANGGDALIRLGGVDEYLRLLVKQVRAKDLDAVLPLVEFQPTRTSMTS